METTFLGGFGQLFDYLIKRTLGEWSFPSLPLWLSDVLSLSSCVYVHVLKGTVDLEREEGEECEENMEVFDDSSSSPSGTLRNYPLTCKVLYSYKVGKNTQTYCTCGVTLCRYMVTPTEEHPQNSVSYTFMYTIRH